MNNNRRRNFRPRAQKNSFRRRQSVNSSDGVSNFNNGNIGFKRNGSMNNLHNVEKTMQKFNQVAKDAQSNGDPVLAQNYLQHADHYLRRYNELSEKKESLTEKSSGAVKTITQLKEETTNNKEDLQNSN